MRNIGDLNRGVQLSSASHDFDRYAALMMATRFNRAEALKSAGDASPRVREILKSAVDTGTTSDSDWGSPLVGYRQIVSGFLQSLAPFSAFQRIMTDGSFLTVPFKTFIAIASTAARGSGIISELAAKPVSEMGFTQALFEPRKVAPTVIVNSELVRFMTPDSLARLGDELRRAVAQAIDEIFLAILTTATSVATDASTGMTATQFIHDLDRAAQAISLGANSRVYLILPPDVCKQVALMRDTTGNLVFPQMTVTGGTIQGIRCLVSDSATTEAVLLDASQIAANQDTVVVGEMTHASVVVDDNPTSGAQSLVSLFQANKVGIRVEHFFNAEVLRSTAVAVITGFSPTA
jgi:HK97 family phage major capsid protein